MQSPGTKMHDTSTLLHQLGTARVLLVFAHPDDESVALGARLGILAKVRLLHVTDGAPRDGADSSAYGFASPSDYAKARFLELEHALHTAGAANMQRSCLGIPDQQASLRLVQVTHDIAAHLEQHQPDIVVTHPYEGGHPDHDACAFAIHHAVTQAACAPVIVEAASYHQGPNGIETGCFLPSATDGQEVRVPLSAEEQQRKRDVFACFATQRDTLQYFPTSEERFRLAPAYDFTHPPHAGAVFYDRYPWGMTSAHFCALAAAAQQTLKRSRNVPCP